MYVATKNCKRKITQSKLHIPAIMHNFRKNNWRIVKKNNWEF